MVPPGPGAPDFGCRAPGLVAAGLRAVLLNPPSASGALHGVLPPDGRALEGMRREPVPEPSAAPARLSAVWHVWRGRVPARRARRRGGGQACGELPRRGCQPAWGQGGGAGTRPRMPFLLRSWAEQPAGAGNPQLSATGRSVPSTFRWHPNSVTPGCPGTPGRHRRG